MPEKSLKGKVALVSGGSQGLGRSVAVKFLEAGASVMICARSKTELFRTHTELKAFCMHGQMIEAIECDVANETEVALLVDQTLTKLGGCHILVNNAGIYGPKGLSEDNDWEAWKQTFDINVFGSVLLCRRLIPHFRAQKYGKIIQLSGGGATSPLPRLTAYASSKAAIVRYIETISRELKGTGVDVNSIAPGALNTGMLDEILDAGPSIVGQEFYEKSKQQAQSGGAPLDNAASLICMLASPQGDGITGKLISALWDNWDMFPKHTEEITNSDVLTLRRTIGKDFDLEWIDK